MGLLDSVRSAASRASEAVVQLKQDVAEKVSVVEDKASQFRAEVSGQVSSFAREASKPELLGGARAQLSADSGSGGTTVRAGDPASIAAKLVAAEKKATWFDADDVALEQAKGFTPDQLQGLAQTTEGREALKVMISEMKSGYTTDAEQTQIDRLQHAIDTTPLLVDQEKQARTNNPNPSTSMIGTNAGAYAGKTTPWSDAETAQIQKVDTLVAANTIASKGSAAEVDAVVKKTLDESKGLPPLMAGDLLSRTCDSLLAQGHTDAARQLAQELKSPRLAGQSVNTVDRISGPSGQTVAPNGNHIDYLAQGGVSGKLGEVGDTRLAQADQIDRMTRALGRKVDPQNVSDLKEYFAHVKKDQGMPGAAKEFQAYVNAFAKHPGGQRTEWKDEKSKLVDPEKLTGILAGQPRDGAGRTILDCEGHSWLAAAVFGKDNEVVFNTRADHIAVTVFDKKTGEGFMVNTMLDERVKVLDEKPLPKTEKERNARATQYFVGDGKKTGVSSPGSLGYVGTDATKT